MSNTTDGTITVKIKPNEIATDITILRGRKYLSIKSRILTFHLKEYINRKQTFSFYYC